nr:CBO0543 family protein [Neobacillus sp. Marseille-Q6967]
MLLESWIELSAWVVSAVLLWLGVSKGKIREALLSFLFMQSVTYLLGGLTVEWKLISYPERIMGYAYRTNFTFEYFVFPAVSVLFNLYFPKRGSMLKKFLYSISFPSIIIIGEVLVEKYTDNIEYLHWNWFFSWASMLVTLCFGYLFYKWFFKKLKKI